MSLMTLRWLAAALLTTSGALSAVIALDTLWGEAGWPHHQVMQREVEAILRENDALARKLHGLKRDIAAQGERPEVQEALVRDLLGYVRADDVIVRLDINP